MPRFLRRLLIPITNGLSYAHRALQRMNRPSIEINDNAEWKTGLLHSISWSHQDQGWRPLAQVFDEFIAAAITGIANETTTGSANWLFFNFEFGRLMVYPSAEDAFECTRSELVFFQLHCDRIDKETGQCLVLEERLGPDGKVAQYVRRPNDVPEWVDEDTHQKISRRKWALVHQCLLSGKAAAALATARRRHAMKIAAFEFDPAEGNHFLLDLTAPEFIESWERYQALANE